MLQLTESVAFTFFELFSKIGISQMSLNPLCYYKETQVVLSSRLQVINYSTSCLIFSLCRLRQHIFDMLDIKLISDLVSFLYLRRKDAVPLP